MGIDVCGLKDRSAKAHLFQLPKPKPSHVSCSWLHSPPQRTRIHSTPQHWRLCHIEFEFEFHSPPSMRPTRNNRSTTTNSAVISH